MRIVLLNEANGDKFNTEVWVPGIYKTTSEKFRRVETHCGSVWPRSDASSKTKNVRSKCKRSPFTLWPYILCFCTFSINYISRFASGDHDNTVLQWNARVSDFRLCCPSTIFSLNIFTCIVCRNSTTLIWTHYLNLLYK